MALAVVYTTMHGMLVHENRGGVETFYAPDPLGSLIQCRDTSGNVTYSAEYWPYGEVQTETGSNPSPWSFVGLLGYLRDSASRCYVRARYYTSALAKWISGDANWWVEPTYQYCYSRPEDHVDPGGNVPIAMIGPPIWNGGGSIHDLKRIQPTSCWDAAARLITAWWFEAEHTGNHAYTHCMACCELSRGWGDLCALDRQQTQNWISGYKRNEGDKNKLRRVQYCAQGIMQGRKCGSCHDRCVQKYPHKESGLGELIVPWV